VGTRMRHDVYSTSTPADALILHFSVDKSACKKGSQTQRIKSYAFFL